MIYQPRTLEQWQERADQRGRIPYTPPEPTDAEKIAEQLREVEWALDGHTELVARARETAREYAAEQWGWGPIGPELTYLGRLADKLCKLADVLGDDVIDEMVEKHRLRIAMSYEDEDEAMRGEP
jgi:hypothetical protein